MSTQAQTKVLAPVADLDDLTPEEAEEKLLIGIRSHEYMHGLPRVVTVRGKFFSQLPKKIQNDGFIEVERREDKSLAAIMLIHPTTVYHYDQAITVERDAYQEAKTFWQKFKEAFR